MKNQNGFTLVETIVVSVIVAILAAVAIPIYSGYIHDQKISTVSNLAETAAASANAYARKTGVTLKTEDVPQLNLYYDKAKYSITIDGNEITVQEIKDSKITATKTF